MAGRNGHGLIYIAWQRIWAGGSDIVLGMSLSLPLEPVLLGSLWVALPPPAPHFDEAIW
jgi:hypothetical protein